jgi:Oxidoreductase family, NAD-binding Rossmann fold
MSKPKKLSRRQFIEQTAIVGAASVVAPSLLQASSPLPVKKVRVSVIGCGSVSTQYLPHISKSPHVELVSTCDIIPERAQKAAEQYGIKHWYPHIDQLLAGEPFDLLLNLTDMQEHAAGSGQVQKFAHLGCPRGGQ